MLMLHFTFIILWTLLIMTQVTLFEHTGQTTEK